MIDPEDIAYEDRVSGDADSYTVMVVVKMIWLIITKTKRVTILTNK